MSSRMSRVQNDPKFSAEKLQDLGIDLIDVNDGDYNINYNQIPFDVDERELKHDSLLDDINKEKDNDSDVINISDHRDKSISSSNFVDNKDPEKRRSENSVVLSEKNKSGVEKLESVDKEEEQSIKENENEEKNEENENEEKNEENEENKDENENEEKNEENENENEDKDKDKDLEDQAEKAEENKDEENEAEKPLTESEKIEAEIAIVKTFPLLKTQEDALQRMEIFEKLKQNNNDTIKPAEIDIGLRNLYSFAEKFLTKDVISRAFFSSKNSKIKRHINTEDEMEKNELRTFLVYLRQYAEYFEMFDLIKTEDSKKIKFDEFSSALPVLSKWGIEIDDPKSAFDGIDTEGNGEILFQEFCHWAIKKNLEIECKDENLDDEELAKEE